MLDDLAALVAKAVAAGDVGLAARLLAAHAAPVARPADVVDLATERARRKP